MNPADDDLDSLDLQLPEPIHNATLHVAFSGGLDSSVLLHLLSTRFSGRVHAIHIHHGLQSGADEWVRHCAEVCANLSVPFSQLRVQIDAADTSGPEAAARHARYDALRSLMSDGDCLVTAHHRDDQAETVLLRLLRGSGPHGLAGMRRLSVLSPGWLWRPLLGVPRAQLQTYAESHGLRWIEDPHNGDPRYARSWLRGAVLPILKQRFPQFSRSLARTAQLAAEANELLDEVAAQDALIAARGAALSVGALLNLSTARRHNLLRSWLREQTYEVPIAADLARIAPEVLEAAPDARPCLAWAGCELRRYRDLLFAMAPLPALPVSWSAVWAEGERFDLPAGCGYLQAGRSPTSALTVRLPRLGESIKLAGASHHRTLKNLFQEAGVPPWVRARSPVIEQDGEIVAVAGLGGTERWRSDQVSNAAPIFWRHRLSGLSSPIAL